MKEIKVSNLTADDFPLPVRPFFENFEAEKPLQLSATIASIIAYQAMAPRLRTHYVFDNEDSMLLCNLLVVGPSGSGKSHIRHIVTLLTTDMLQEDMQQRRILQACQEANKRTSSAKDKEEEPLVCIRMLMHFTLPVVTKYSDLQFRKFGDYLGFFLFADELATLCETKRNRLDLQAVARTAFSKGEFFCKDTLYQDGYNAMTDIIWNSILLGQETSLNEYITKKGLLCGDASRQIIINLGDSLAEEAPIFHPLTQEQQKAVNDAIKKLKSETYTMTGDTCMLQPTHQVDMSWLFEDVQDWCAKQRIIIAKTGSRAHDSFFKRASVSAFRLCTMLYHLWNEEEEHQEKVRKCYWYFAQNILDAQLQQWGEQYESAMGKEKDAQSANPSLFDSMPESFTREQLCAKINEKKLGTSARQFIHKWKKNRWIFVDEETKVIKKLYEVSA